jgi:protein SCO1/2
MPGVMRSLIAAVLLAAALAPQILPAQQQSSRTAADLMDAVMWGKEPIGGPFALTDHAGKPRTDRDFLGKILVVYFGFMSCPDICPTELLSIAQAIDKLGAQSNAVQPLFITLDPERDTPERLADYVSAFHPRLIGLTGGAEDIRKVAEIFRVFYAKVPLGEGHNYTIDHMGFVYLMDRAGRYIGFLPPGTPTDKMVAVLRPHLAASDKH